MPTETPSTSTVIDSYRRDFEMVLPTHLRAEQWIRVTTGTIRREPKIAEILRANPGSVLSALLDAARLGLEIGDTYHLVPFKNEIVGVIDYTGLIELMYRAGAVSTVKAEVVREHDHFDYSPSMRIPDHRPAWFSDRGNIIGAYAYAEMKDGGVSRVIVRSKAEIEQVRDVSPSAGSKESPWKKWPDRMALKTVVRELAKFVPTSAEQATTATHLQNSRPRQEHAGHAHTAPQPRALEGSTEVDVTTGEILDDESPRSPSPQQEPV